MNKKIIVGIILIILCLGLTIFYEIKTNKIYANRVNLYEITNSGSKKENIDVYLETTFVAGEIKKEKNEKNNYYVFFGDGVQYIVYISDKKANEIYEYLIDNPEDSYKIIGKTKLISESMEENGIKFVKEWLDKNHHHEEESDDSHDITKEEFYHYFGHVYLDTTHIIPNYLSIIKIIIYLFGISGILFIFSPITRKIW